MVRKISDSGNIYHEPPYTKVEEADFYRRIGQGPVTILKGRATQKTSTEGASPQKSPLQSPKESREP